MNKEEPQRVSTLVTKQAITKSKSDISVDVIALEKAEGPVTPQDIQPTNRASSFFAKKALGRTAGKYELDTVSVEVACKPNSAEFYLYNACLECAEGEVVPRDLSPYNRISLVLTKTALTATASRFMLEGVAMEVAHKKDIYSKYSNVQLIY